MKKIIISATLFLYFTSLLQAQTKPLPNEKETIDYINSIIGSVNGTITIPKIHKIEFHAQRGTNNCQLDLQENGKVLELYLNTEHSPYCTYETPEYIRGLNYYFNAADVDSITYSTTNKGSLGNILLHVKNEKLAVYEALFRKNGCNLDFDSVDMPFDPKIPGQKEKLFKALQHMVKLAKESKPLEILSEIRDLTQKKIYEKATPTTHYILQLSLFVAGTSQTIQRSNYCFSR